MILGSTYRGYIYKSIVIFSYELKASLNPVEK